MNININCFADPPPQYFLSLSPHEVDFEYDLCPFSCYAPLNFVAFSIADSIGLHLIGAGFSKYDDFTELP